MTLYGVEHTFIIEDYQFQIGYDSGNECGLDQRDVEVSRRLRLDEIDLSTLPGRSLLEAYAGLDREARLIAWHSAEETVRTRYKQARRAPRANSNTLLRQEKSELKQHEKALAEQLGQLDRSLFDQEKLTRSIQHFTDARMIRSFYYEEVNFAHMRNFCQKYATDPAYRQAVENGSAPWVERNAIFVKNLWSPSFRDQLASLDALASDAVIKKLWHWLGRVSTAITALPEYRQLKQLDTASAPPSAHPPLDPGIREAVEAWNVLPGVETKFSCQGASGTVTYEGRRLLVPCSHDEFAYIVFARLDEPIIAALDVLLPTFPAIRTNPFRRVVGSHDRAPRKYRYLQSSGDNLLYRREMVRLAHHIQEYLEQRPK